MDRGDPVGVGESIPIDICGRSTRINGVQELAGQRGRESLFVACLFVNDADDKRRSSAPPSCDPIMSSPFLDTTTLVRIQQPHVAVEAFLGKSPAPPVRRGEHVRRKAAGHTLDPLHRTVHASVVQGPTHGRAVYDKPPFAIRRPSEREQVRTVFQSTGSFLPIPVFYSYQHSAKRSESLSPALLIEALHDPAWHGGDEATRVSFSVALDG